MKNKIIFLCIAFILVTINLFADTITLKSGKQIEGKILERADKSVKIEAYGVELTYFNDEIDKINDEKITTAVQESAPAIEEEKNVIQITDPIQAEEIKSTSIPAKAAQDQPISSTSMRHTGRESAFMGGLMLVFLILGLIFYIYSAICLQIIAQKTNKEPLWLAWIPIGNLFLMCKIGSISYIWLLGFLLGFIPFIGMLFNLALLGYIWYNIALARNKPGWLGILACLPIINLVIMGYLAFSD